MGPRNCQVPSHTNGPLDFYRERGAIVIEEKFGWCNYYVGDGIAYLENLHIYPEFRKQQKATSLLNRVELDVRENHGIKFLNTTVALLFNDKERALSVCLKRGFKFISSNNDAILLRKELYL